MNPISFEKMSGLLFVSGFRLQARRII